MKCPGAFMATLRTRPVASTQKVNQMGVDCEFPKLATTVVGTPSSTSRPITWALVSGLKKSQTNDGTVSAGDVCRFHGWPGASCVYWVVPIPMGLPVLLVVQGVRSGASDEYTLWMVAVPELRASSTW